MRTRLRHVAQVNPLSHRFDRLTDDELITFLPMENVWPGDRLDLTQMRPKSSVATGYTRFETGDVVVPKITPTFEASRSVLIPEVPHSVGAGTTELHVVRPSEEIDPRYLLYIFHSHNFLKIGESELYGVAGQKRVPDDLIRDWTIDLPSLDEQRRIADFLDAETTQIDGLRAKRLAQISVLDELELALIGKHLATAKSTGPVYAYYEVQLGKKLNAATTSGEGQAQYLRNANVHWYEIDTSDMATMSFDPAERRFYALRAGDLLVCEGGAGVAEAAVWDAHLTTCFYQMSLHRVRSRQNVPVEWLMYWLRYAKAIGVLSADGKLATIPHLTAEQFAEYRIPIPEDGQRHVGDLSVEIATIREAQRKMEAANAVLAERRQALITAAVTGGITV